MYSKFNLHLTMSIIIQQHFCLFLLRCLDLVWIVGYFFGNATNSHPQLPLQCNGHEGNQLIIYKYQSLGHGRLDEFKKSRQAIGPMETIGDHVGKPLICVVWIWLPTNSRKYLKREMYYLVDSNKLCQGKHKVIAFYFRVKLTITLWVRGKNFKISQHQCMHL